MKPRSTAVLASVVLLAVTGCQESGTSLADQNEENEQQDRNGEGGSETEEVTVHDAEGQELGTVTFEEAEESVTISADLEGLTPGFHGFHLHETGECDPDVSDGPFATAGGHFDPEGQDHPGHAGDMPPLLVLEDGTASLSLETDRFALADLADEDGSAVIVHSDPDNFANIPERYLDDSTPDEDTLGTGDAGDRAACGVIAEPAN